MIMNLMKYFGIIKMNELALRNKATIFIDENLYQLKDGLKDYGFKVILLEKGMSDEKIKELAEGWLILTKNEKDFIDDAKAFDYDIISIRTIKYIDTNKTRKNSTVKKIADAIRYSGISLKKGNFLLEVFDNGKHRLQSL